MTNPLDFSVTTNTDVVIEQTILVAQNDACGNLLPIKDLLPYNLTSVQEIIIQAFYPNSNHVAFTKKFSLGEVIVVSPATAGKIQYEILHTDSVDFVAGAYKWQASIIGGDGKYLTVTNGDRLLTSGIITFIKQLVTP